MLTGDDDQTIKELRDTLQGYSETETTRQVYDLCSYLLGEIVGRVNQLDSKAGQVAAFYGASLALLLSTYSIWREQVDANLFFLALVLIAVIFLGLAGWFAFDAMRVTEFDWFSDREIVFPKKLLNFPDELRRYHVLAIYRSMLFHERVSARKARRVHRSETLFLGGAVLIAVCLVCILLRPWAAGLLSSLGNRLARRNF